MLYEIVLVDRKIQLIVLPDKLWVTWVCNVMFDICFQCKNVDFHSPFYPSPEMAALHINEFIPMEITALTLFVYNKPHGQNRDRFYKNIYETLLKICNSYTL